MVPTSFRLFPQDYLLFPSGFRWFPPDGFLVSGGFRSFLMFSSDWTFGFRMGICDVMQMTIKILRFIFTGKNIFF